MGSFSKSLISAGRLFALRSDGLVDELESDDSGGLKIVEQNPPHEKFYTSFLLGDSSSDVTVAASGTAVTGLLDATRLRTDMGTMVLVIAGDGTAKVQQQVSRDGSANFTDATDIITGKTAGVHPFALNASGMLYGHFHRYNIVETGGASTVTAKLFIMARGG